jgi:hypothetical protein
VSSNHIDVEWIISAVDGKSILIATAARDPAMGTNVGTTSIQPDYHTINNKQTKDHTYEIKTRKFETRQNS